MSRAGSSAARSPTAGAPATAPTQDDAEAVSPVRETSPVPLQTVYMQVIELLLDVKAMPVSAFCCALRVISCMGCWLKYCY